MKIIALEVENVKRVHAVSIKPDGSLIEITGRNAQGKSSVLDAIWYCLGGSRGVTTKVIRDGESRGRVLLKLSDGWSVSKVFTKVPGKGERHTLLVEQNGSTQLRPQSFLDGLLGDLAFDPEAFTRMSPTDQLATLKRVCGLDFSELDAKRKQLYDVRTTVNHDLKAVEAQRDAIPDEQAPDEEVSVAELAKKHADASGLIAEHAGLVTDMVTSEVQIRQWSEQIKELQAKIDLNGPIMAKGRKMIDEFVAPDVNAIQAKIDDAENINKRARSKKERTVLDGKANRLIVETDGLSEKIKLIDSQKARAIAEADMPIDGLGFSDEGVLFNGLPFENAASSEQLRTSCAIGIATSGPLRIMRIVNGSLLDETGRAIVAEMAEKHDMQVFMERVTDGENVGVVIEDGYVREGPNHQENDE